MNRVVPAMAAGFVATVVLSLLMIIKSMMGLMPGLDVIHMLSHMAHAMIGTAASPAIGWVIHFLIGTVAWGVLFAVLYPILPGRSSVAKGLVFSVLAWLLMMLIPLPMAGAGLFGLHMGLMAPVMTLVLHLIWGAVLGGTFQALGRWSQPDRSPA